MMSLSNHEAARSCRLTLRQAQGEDLKFRRMTERNRQRRLSEAGPLTNGLPSNCFAGVLRGSMAGDQMAPGGLYFGTTAGAIYASANLGESWKEIASHLPRIMSVHAYVT